MHFFRKQAFLPFLFTAAIFALFTSCMPEAGESPSQLVIGVQVKDLDSTLTAGNDSLKINRVRFIHGESFFTISEDSTIRLTGRAQQISFSAGTPNAVKLIYPFPPGAPAPFPEGVYQGLTFKIVRAKSVPDDEPNYNPDPVFTDGGNYSIVVNGAFNGKDFTFKASKNFSYNFDFTPPVTVTSEAKVYRFLISAKLESWFINDQGSGFLNPADGKEKGLIYENISQSFMIEQLSP